MGMMHFRVPATALVLTVVASLLQVQPRVSASQVSDRERTLFVSAVSERGEPVENLGPRDFIVREDGTQREVLRASQATEPIDIALLVDNAASSGAALVPMREGLRRFVARMAPMNQIAIIGLADRPTILVDYTSDMDLLEAGIGRVFTQSNSGMALLNGVVETARGLERRETPRAVIIPVITEGVEFTNYYSRDVTQALTGARAALHAVTIGGFYPSGNDVIERERERVLNESTRDSGGQRVTMFDPNGVTQALDRLAAELSSQYKVVYVRPQSLIPPETTEVSSARADIAMRATPMRGE